VRALKNDAAFPRKPRAPETAGVKFLEYLVGLIPTCDLVELIFVKTD
jgi:hypothetical protein